MTQSKDKYDSSTSGVDPIHLPLSIHTNFGKCFPSSTNRPHATFKMNQTDIPMSGRGFLKRVARFLLGDLILI